MVTSCALNLQLTTANISTEMAVTKRKYNFNVLIN